MIREEFIINQLNNRDYKVGAEIGSYLGKFANHILKNWNGTLYLIDVWRKLETTEYVDMSNKDIEDNVWLSAMKSIRGYEDRALMMRMYSNQAAQLFSDNSLDFVYIDANHKYDAVKEDIELWWPKIKSGGMLSGHDYIHSENWNSPPFAENGIDKHIYLKPPNTSDEHYTYAGMFGVYPAVNEFAKQNNYEIQYTDEYLSSWFIFKR